MSNETKIEIGQLYRYLPLGNSKKKKNKFRKRIKGILLSNEIFLTDPTKFNDPFDRPHINFDGSNEEWNVEIDKQVDLLRTKKGKPLSPVNRLKLINQYKRRNKSQHFRANFQTKVQQNFCLLCMSLNADAILMWSHYADSHKGLCLGFDTNLFMNTFENIYPVKYRDKYPRVSILDATNGLKILEAFNTKHRNWAYEDEVRFANLHPAKLIKIPSEALKSIYLGCEIDDKNKKFLMDLLSQRTLQVNLFQAEKIFITLS